MFLMKNKKKVIFLYVTIVFLLIHSNGAELTGDAVANCEIQGIEDVAWSTQFNVGEFKKTEKDPVFRSNYSHITGMDKDCDKYFCIKLDQTNKNLTISPSDLTKIDEDPQYQGQDKAEVTSNVIFNCDDGGKKQLAFKITIDDVNLHQPNFLKPGYNYKLPMPMPPGIDITTFGDDINVEDEDFSNKNITCSTDKKYISCNSSSIGNSLYKLQLEFSKVKKLFSTETIKLTATDSGKPPLNKTVSVNIEVDETISEPPPFKKSVYFYDYNSVTPAINAIDGDAELLNSWDGMNCTIVENVYQPYVNVKIEKGETKVNLSLAKPFDDDIVKDGVAQMTIQCYVYHDVGVSEAAVLIYVQKNPSNPVTFKQKIYTGKYEISEAEQTISLDNGKITITEATDGFKVSIDSPSDLVGYFETVKAADGWDLRTKKPLNGEKLKGAELNLIIKLSKDDDDSVLDNAFITLLLPNVVDGVDFSESYFEGDYIFGDDGKGSMTPIKITLSNSNFEIDKDEEKGCGLDENDYSTFFAISCEAVDDIKLTLKNGIPKEKLKDETVPLSMYLNLKSGQIKRSMKTTILLNLLHEDPSPTSSTTTEVTTTESSADSDSDDCSHTGWIITTIVVFILFVIYVIVTVVYYLKRIRNRTETEFCEPTRQKTIQFEPHTEKRTSEKFKAVSTRRPTGFIRYNPDKDRDSLDSEYGDAQDEVNNNTNTNKFLNNPEGTFTDYSNHDNTDRRNIGFVIPPSPEP